MANVYRALDEKLGRYVAVKILHEHLQRNPDIRSRFQQEAQAVSTLDHPNIVRIYDFSGPDNEQLWLVAELINGTTLSKIQETQPNQRLPQIAAACIVREITRALEHAHKSGIVHRDIKPENVMVTTDGRLKLMDFGIAKDTQNHRKTQTGMFMGSPSYMSPEQIRGRNIDGRSDICSLGVVFYELLTSRLPFEGENSAAVIEKITRGEFVYPRFRTHGLNLELDKMVVRCLQKQPELRYQSISELGMEIDNWLIQNRIFSSTQELEQFILTGGSGQPRTLSEVSGAEFTGNRISVAVTGNTKRLENTSQHETYIDAPAPGKTKVRTAKPRRLTPDTQLIQENTAENRSPRHSKARPQMNRKPRRPNQHLRRRHPEKFSPPQASYVYRVARSTSGSQLPIILAMIVALVMGLLWTTDFKPISEIKRFKSAIHHQVELTITAVTELLSRPKLAPNQSNRPDTRKITAQTGPAESQNQSSPNASKVENDSKAETASSANSPQLEKPNQAPRRKPQRNSEVRKLPEKKPENVAVVTRDNKRSSQTNNLSDKQTITKSQPTATAADMTAGRGKIAISSRPAAEIYINNQRVGTTVDTGASSGWIAIDSGKIKITLKRPGYRDYIRRLTLKNNERLTLNNIDLEKATTSRPSAQTTAITIVSNKWPAEVLISPLSRNGSRPRKITLNQSRKTFPVSPGRYLVRVQSGDEVRERRIDTTISSSGITYSVEFDNLRSSKRSAPSPGSNQQ